MVREIGRDRDEPLNIELHHSGDKPSIMEFEVHDRPKMSLIPS
jgi:hypothetical protein